MTVSAGVIPSVDPTRSTRMRSPRVWRSFPSVLLGEVGRGHALGVPGGPLDQLDPVAVGVGDPRGPEVSGAVGRTRGLDANAAGRELGHDVSHGLDLDDDVVEPTGGDHLTARPVNEF